MPPIRFDRRAIPPDARLVTWTAPDGWDLRRFDWPVASVRPRGSILFQAGRGDFVEKYLEAFGDWHDRGWSVTAFDWRGQGGSGRLAVDRHVGHAGDFSEYMRDLAHFWRDWADQASGPCVLIGHSMGGHLALRAMLEGLARPDAAVLIAPMLGLHSPVGSLLGEGIAQALARFGGPGRSAWKAGEIPGARTGRQALLTHDDERYSDERWWHERDPMLKLGPPSWGWVAGAFTSVRKVAHDRRLRDLDVPILMLVAEADRLVCADTAIAIAGRLPRAELVRFGAESAHEILRESDAVRVRALEAIDRFLGEQAPVA